jgi:YqjK-like protein
MSDRLHDIVRRRRLLVALATEQRGELAVQAAAVQQSLSFAELAWRGYRRLKSNPLVVAVVVAGFAAIGPLRLLRSGYRSGLTILGLLRLVKLFRNLS